MSYISQRILKEIAMFVTKSHLKTSLFGTYHFPYVVGTINKDRCWQRTDQSPLTGDLSEDHISNQLFSINHRLNKLGSMLTSSQYWIESIGVSNENNISMTVTLMDSTGFMSDREVTRARRWESFVNLAAKH